MADPDQISSGPPDFQLTPEFLLAPVAPGGFELALREEVERWMAKYCAPHPVTGKPVPPLVPHRHGRH
jgi:hypothetical protein